MEGKEIVTLEKWYKLSKMAKGKRQVLLAALQLFAENGINSTSTAQIAQKANVSQATIFKYFHTKDELLMTILEPLFSQLFPEYKADFKDKLVEISTTNGLSLKQVVYLLIKNRFEILFENRNAAMILITGILIDDKIRQKVVTLFQANVEEIGGQLLQLLKKFDEFNTELSLKEVLRIIIGQIGSYIIMHEKIDKKAPYNLETDLDQICFEIYRAITK